MNEKLVHMHGGDLDAIQISAETLTLLAFLKA